MGSQNMRRPLDKHLSQGELNALVVQPFKGNFYLPEGIRQAEHHLLACEDCSRKLFLLRQVSSPPTGVREPDPAGTDCPKDEDVDWYEVAGGLWPELKARQLIMHAAQCGHCGPLLRAALSVDADPTPEEESLLAQLRKPSRPESAPVHVLRPRQAWQWRFARWAMPVAALIVIVVLVRNRPARSSHGLSGQEFAMLAANTYRQQAQGMLALDVHADSQQQLNEWFKANSQLPVVLPSSSLPSGEKEPFRVRGARLIPLRA